MVAYNPDMTLKGLYLITPDEDDAERLLARVADVLSAGPALVQYRNKRASPTRQRKEAEALKSLCDSAGIPLIVNDDWRLALAIGAAGAHLGASDGDLAEARREAPTLLLGASCYDDLEAARRAKAMGADYVAFGAFFPSATKPLARRARATLLEESADLGVPRAAIGGISTDNAGTLVAAGADLIAVVGGVFDAPDPSDAARQLASLFPLPERTRPLGRASRPHALNGPP